VVIERQVIKEELDDRGNGDDVDKKDKKDGRDNDQ